MSIDKDDTFDFACRLTGAPVVSGFVPTEPADKPNIDLTRDLPEIEMSLRISEDGSIRYMLNLPGREYAGAIPMREGMNYPTLPWHRLIQLVVSEVQSMDKTFHDELSERFMLG